MILIFGRQGQLAQSLQATEPAEFASQAVYVSSHDANFEKPELLHGFLDRYQPTVVIVASAYTKVDLAEDEKMLCETLNVEAPIEIARWCGKNDATLIYYSSDYVFSGEGSGEWVETDTTAPLNWYGETKERAEEGIWLTGCRHFIFRTSWVYSEYGKNFVRTMLKAGSEKTHLRIVNDQVGGPTYAPELAALTWQVSREVLQGVRKPSGVYHAAGKGFTTWAEFAEEIFREARLLGWDLKIETIEKIPSQEFPTPATRPLNSRLNQDKLKQTFGFEFKDWKEALALCLKRLGAPPK